MFCFFAIVIPALSVDHQSPQVDDQLICLSQVLRVTDITELSQNLKRHDITPSNLDFITRPCEWRGVQCTEGVVTDIHWCYNNAQTCDFNWFPPATEKIQMEQMRPSPNTLDTRRLPRNLKKCWMIDSHLHGEINMETLPESLEIFSVPNNEISGVIRLTRLPRSLTSISFLNNKVQKVIVANQALPASLVKGGFYQIKNPKLFCVDEKHVDSRINCLYDTDTYGSNSDYASTDFLESEQVSGDTTPSAEMSVLSGSLSE